MPPYRGGGDMISSVSFEKSTWNELPYKFEAGTPNIAGVVGLGAAIEYLENLDLKEMLLHEQKLAQYVWDELSKNPDIKLYNHTDPETSIGIISFSHAKVHPHDLAAIADSESVCMRAGHHCAQPLMRALDIHATSRVSPYIYNDEEDMEAFLRALHKAEKTFS